MLKSDSYETELLAAYDRGSLGSVATKAELSKFKAAARATAIKDRRAFQADGQRVALVVRRLSQTLDCTIRQLHQYDSCIMRIEVGNLSHPAIQELLSEHLANMYELSPPEQVFALDLSKLMCPDITFWTVWDDNLLLGCGALKELTSWHGEIKSMRTPAQLRGRGAGRVVLDQIIATARQRRYSLLSLETGTHPAFLAAQQLYKSVGFQESGPFANYKEDPHSLFMELRLPQSAG